MTKEVCCDCANDLERMHCMHDTIRDAITALAITALVLCSVDCTWSTEGAIINRASPLAFTFARLGRTDASAL